MSSKTARHVPKLKNRCHGSNPDSSDDSPDEILSPKSIDIQSINDINTHINQDQINQSNIVNYFEDDDDDDDYDEIDQIIDEQQRCNWKKSQFTLPIRSFTLDRTTEEYADRKSLQLIKSFGIIDGKTTTGSTTTATTTAATATTTATTTSGAASIPSTSYHVFDDGLDNDDPNDDDINEKFNKIEIDKNQINNDEKKINEDQELLNQQQYKINIFKTKRFYESCDDVLMTHLFSQTIRSTSVTPTDEQELLDLYETIDDTKRMTPSPSLSSILSPIKSIVCMNRIQTTIKENDNGKIMKNQKISTILTKTHNNDTNDCDYTEIIDDNNNNNNNDHLMEDDFIQQQQQQQHQEQLLLLYQNDDNPSINDMSSQNTENCEMYNESNLSSLIDNMNIDDEFICDDNDDDTNDIVGVKTTKTRTTTITTATTTITTPLAPTTNIENGEIPTVTIQRTLKSIIKRCPSIVVEFFDADLSKHEELKMDCGFYDVVMSTPTEINNDKQQDQQIPEIEGNIGILNSQIMDRNEDFIYDDREPVVHVATPIDPVVRSSIKSYFHITIEDIEEEDDDQTNVSSIQNTLSYELYGNDETQKDDHVDEDKSDLYMPNESIKDNNNIDEDDDMLGASGVYSYYVGRTTTNTSVGKMESRSTSTKTTTKITSSIKTIGINQNSQQIGNYDEEEYCVPKKSDLTPKKKAKKSRKSDHQKESISVKKIFLMDQPPNNTKQKKYQKNIIINRRISVKYLCRSFGDLTQINIENNNKYDENDINLKKSSFSKFDALQKRNDLHEGEKKTEKKCRACYKDVYKMEEIRAEQSIWHRNCFRCVECGKQLNVDTYQSHESLLYCRPHFRLLFAPKAVEDNEPQKTRKPELIIRENQPVELPPDVVRASDKPDLGLEELHQLNVKSRFQVFENYKDNKSIPSTSDHVGFKKSTSILSKLAKFQAKGMDVGITDDSLNGIPLEPSDDEDIELNPDGDEDIDVDLILARNASKRERPINFCNMNDIKTKFENGHSLTREERREERKQEIQNIRSRLFMGKQARIKEMYQQAVADSEQGQTSTGKKPEIDIGDMARSLKEKFEKGQIFKNKENNENESKIQDEDVFEQGISKKSRSIFMELDANASKSPQNNLSLSPSSQQISAKPKTQTQVSPLQPAKLKPFTGENVVKCDEKPDDVKIETSEISSKFKFFETYKPDSNKMKKEFRITPPRDGVVKLPSPEHDIYIDPNVIRSNDKNNTDDPIVAETSHTTTKMLSLFRQMEEKKFNRQQHHDDDIDDPEYGLKPLKRFTPPLDENRRFYLNDSDDGDDEEDEEEEEGEEEGEEEENERRYTDEFLKQAQSAARAKQLRAKFEKWEANEIQREMNNGFVQIYENGDNNEHYNDNESQIESAKSLRAKFESMKDINRNPARPTVQVNRFV